MKFILFVFVSLFHQFAIANMQPTILSKDVAVHVFQEMNDEYTKIGQSADSAYLWAYEMNRSFRINSEKIFIHYTEAFNHIIANKRKTSKCFHQICFPKLKGWEYHVANLVKVEGEKMAFDKTYFSEPITQSEWISEFIKDGEDFLNEVGDQYIEDILVELNSPILTDNERQKLEGELNLIKSSKNPVTGSYEIKCKMVQEVETHFSEEQTAWCHTQITDMYVWNQRDLAKYDPYHPYPDAPKNVKKTDFKKGILKSAYKNVGNLYNLTEWLEKIALETFSNF